MILPNLANAAMGLKLKSSQKQSTAVGSVAPHSHDSSKDSGAPAPMGNITGNANQNSKIEEIGKKFFQGDQFANQYASKPPVDPAMPVPPQPDPINDQYGNMFMQPFSKKVEGKEHKQKPNRHNELKRKEQFNIGVNMNGDPKKYKIGELLDADDFSDISGQIDLAAEKYSDIQEDKKGQYVTSLGINEYPKQYYDKDFKRPTSSKHIDQWSEKEVERDTIRPRSGKVFISTWKKNK